MSKNGLAMSSLVMAVPAGFLAYLCVMSVFQMNESMPTLLTIIVWTLIVLSSLIALSPFIFLIAGPSGKAVSVTPAAPVDQPEPSKKKPSKKSDDDGEELGEEVDDQLFDTSDDEAGAEDDFDDNFNFDDDDGFDMDEEEEPTPKKKKKK